MLVECFLTVKNQFAFETSEAMSWRNEMLVECFLTGKRPLAFLTGEAMSWRHEKLVKRILATRKRWVALFAIEAVMR